MRPATLSFMNFYPMILMILFSAPYSIIAHLLTSAPLVSLLFINTITFFLLFRNILLIRERRARYVYVVIIFTFLLLLVLNAFIKIPFLAGVDWVNFDSYARSASESSDNLLGIWQNSIDLFVFICALVYKVFGASAEQLYFYIFPAALVLARYIYKTTFLITGKEKYAVLSLFIATLWPVNIVFSVALLREIPIQLLVAISFYHFIRYYKDKKNTRSLAISFLTVTGAIMMHSGMVGLLIAYLYVIIQRKFFKSVKPIRVRALLVMIPVIVLISLTPLWVPLSSRFGVLNTDDGAVRSLQQQQDYLGSASTNYIDSAPNNITEVIISAPYRFIMFALSPLIWQVRDVGTAVAFLVDGLLQLWFAYITIILIRNRKKLEPYYQQILTAAYLCIFFTYLIFSFGTSNYGTAMRHRAKIAPVVMVVVVVYSLERKRISNKMKAAE